MKVPIGDITVDYSLQVRESLDSDTVERYQDSWDSLPPVQLYEVDGQRLLVDGFHRYEAALSLGLAEIEATVTSGTLTEAKEAAILANTKHGKALTKPERNEAIARLSSLGWSVRRIADEMRVSIGTVSHVLNGKFKFEHGDRRQPEYNNNTRGYIRHADPEVIADAIVERIEREPEVRDVVYDRLMSGPRIGDVEQEIHDRWEAQRDEPAESVANALRKFSWAMIALKQLDPMEVVRLADSRQLELFLAGADENIDCIAAIQFAAQKPRLEAVR